MKYLYRGVEVNFYGKEEGYLLLGKDKDNTVRVHPDSQDLERIGRCEYCEDEGKKLFRTDRYLLCEDCSDKYDNKTGYCSLYCCVSGHCDGSC